MTRTIARLHLPSTPLLHSLQAAALFCLLLITGGCRTAPPLDPVNLAEPGWTVRHGQAVWCPRPDAAEIAGDLLVATHSDGRAFVQFSKSPFTVASAARTASEWQVAFPMRHRRYTGRGDPPARLLWLTLAGAAAGQAPPEPWLWRPTADGYWRLENHKTDESLQGFFTP